MTEVRTAIAIRIPRPWQTEAEFIEQEVETISRTGILLLGTHSRPQGTILRFEVTLAGGQPLVRGEGRVVSYNAVAFRGEPGLLLRFTRLDPRSKEFVDRVAAVRRQEGMVSMAPPSMAPARTAEPGPGHERAHDSSSMASTGEIGVLSSKLIVAASAFPLPMEPPLHDATIAPPAAPSTEAPPPAMATIAAPPLMHMHGMHGSTNPPEPPGPASSAPPGSQAGAPRSRRSVPPPLPAAARRSAPPSARTSAPPPPPSLRDASPFEALREQVEARMARRPATSPPVPALPVADVLEAAPPIAPVPASPRVPSEIHPIDAAPSIPALPPEPLFVAPAAGKTAGRTVTAPPNREDLLRRLRTRASAMPAAERAKILTPRAR